jgi:hypothetical protein
VAEETGKRGEMKFTPIAGPFSEIDASGAPGAVKSPADLCIVQWQGPTHWIIDDWFHGDETYAVYQDPTATGCDNTYPFGITDIIWYVYDSVGCTLDVQPVVYENVGTPACPAPGPILCSGPIYHIPLTHGGWKLTLSLDDTCCVTGPYFAGVIVPTNYGVNIVQIVTDSGPPISCRSYNDWHLGWKDLVNFGAPGNLSLWSQGFNTDQNMCGKMVIPPGVDLFETPDDSMTVESWFTMNPIAPDFFGPGSDPFDGIIALEGLPLTTVPSGILGPTDIIIERVNEAFLNVTPSADTVNIKLVGLSLTSTSPITVTYNGGLNPEDWQVDVCLSSLSPPPNGYMYINRDCDSGGSFAANFYNVRLSATFTCVNPPGGPIFVLDPYRTDLRSIANGRWSTFVPSPFSVYTSPGQVEVDGNCDQTPEILIGASSGNFYPGITLEPCPPATCGGKVLTLLDGLLIEHYMLPPQMTSPAVGACHLRDGRCILVDGPCCSSLTGSYMGDYTNCIPCCNHDGIRGDVDMNNMGPNVSDVTRLVSYVKGIQPTLPCFEEADIAAPFGSVNVADVTYLVAYIKGLGPAPPACP